MGRSLLLVLVPLACGGVRTVEAPVESVSASGSVVGAKAVTLGADDCALRLVAEHIEKSQRGCVLDTQIGTTTGLLRYACNGNGPATADFGDQHYTGTIANGALEIKHTSDFDWEDHCHWGTEAVIRGQVAQSGRVAWRYADRVVQGADCSGTCTAKATIRIVPMNAKDKPDDESEDEE